MPSLRNTTEPSSGANWLTWGQAVDDDVRNLAGDAVWMIDSFPGASDDAKFGAALTAAAAATNRPTLMFPPGSFGPLTTTRTAYSGMRLVGPPGNLGCKNPEVLGGTGTLINHEVVVSVGTGGSSLFVNSTTIYDVLISQILFRFTGNGQFFQSTGNVYEAEMNALTFYGAQHILGSTATNFGCTALHLTGQWVCPGLKGTQFHMGGSDCSLWMDGQININGNTVQSGAGTPLIWLDSMQKASIGYIFCTTENDWGGIRISGAQDRANRFFGGCYEGRSPTNVATRPSIDMQGGVAAFFGSWFAHVSGSSGTVSGVIHQSGGVLHLYSPTYERGTSTAATFPLLYQTGGTAVVYHPTSSIAGEQIRIRNSNGVTTTVAAPANLIVA